MSSIIGEEPSECSPHIKKNNGSCLTDSMVSTIKNIVIKDGGDTKFEDLGESIKRPQIIEEAKKATDCQTESCVVDKLTPQIGYHKAQEELKERFKPEGPSHSTDLLSNFNIDDVMAQWVKKFNRFYHITFQMIDFAKMRTELATIDFQKHYNNSNKDTFGVILNTDVSTGGGIHWFALFVDFRSNPITLEYFNSSGEFPYPQVHEWLNDKKFELEDKFGAPVKIVIVGDVQYQKDHHSCGPYSLFYIYGRLNGYSPKIFKNTDLVNDRNMLEFRKHLFRHGF